MASNDRQYYLVGGYVNGEEGGHRTHIRFESRIEANGVEQLAVEQLFDRLLTRTVYESFTGIKEAKKDEDK